MKKLFILFVLFQSLLTAVNAQVPGAKQVPAAVLSQFTLDFPGITPKRWEAKLGKQYEAVLIHHNKACRARYFADGKKHFTSYHHNGADVPSVVTSGILAKFADFKVDWATQIINHEKKTDRFYVRLTKPGHVLKVFVNSDGSVVTTLSDEEKKEMETSE